MNKAVIALAIVAAIGLAGLFVIFSGDDSTQDVLGKAPNFSLKDYDGNIVSLADFQGKNVIVNSWAVWCPFCVEELKDFAKLKQEVGDDIEIIAINRAEPLEKAKNFTDSLNTANETIFLMDSDDSFYRSINGLGMPETIFVDRDGNIRMQKHGPMTLGEMRERAEKMINL